MIGTLGGLLFARIVLAPSSPTEADEQLAPQWKRFGMSVGALWLVVLITGFINYGFVLTKVSGQYHMLAGIKMLLSLAMFALTLFMAHGAKNVRRRGAVLSILVAAGILVVGISAQLNMSRVNGSGLKKTPSVSSAAVE
jgi:cytochrome b561